MNKEADMEETKHLEEKRVSRFIVYVVPAKQNGEFVSYFVKSGDEADVDFKVDCGVFWCFDEAQ